MRLFVFVAVIALLTYGCIQIPISGTPKPGNGTTGNENNGTFGGITQEMCDAARGHWNECGSACRGAPEGTACIMMCVQYCECGGIAGFGCPPGYLCTDYLPKYPNGDPVPDAMGICRKPSG